MKITCPACDAEYNVDQSRVPAAGLNMRCPKCSQSFRVTSDGATHADNQGATKLDSGGQAIKDERFYVKRPTGKVFGPFDRNAVQMMLKSGKLGGDAEISTDKASWQSVLDVPAFSQFVKDKPLPDLSGKSPKSTMVGMAVGRGGSSRDGADDLPAPKDATGGVGLPQPKRADGPPDLPAPKRPGAPPDLPAPKASSGGAGLPQAKRSGPVDLPAPKGASTAGLPQPKGTDLPVPKGSDLPVPKGSELPQAKGDENLPTSVHNKDAGLPVPKSSFEEDLFGGGGDSGGGGDDDLFGDPLGGSDDDLFGDPLGGDDDDLFGAPDAGGGDDDDLFGAPQQPDLDDDDDLFGAPDAGGGDDDDLFGAGPGQHEESDLFGSASEANDDLFGAPTQSPSGRSDDDFLGGDAGFSFLDDEPSAGAPDDEWGDDLFGDSAASEANESESTGGWGDDLIDEPPRVERRQSTGPAPEEHDPFRPASRGLRDEEEQESATVSKDQAVDDDRKRGGIMMIAVPVLAIALIGGGGYLAYTMFAGEESTTTTTVKSEGPTEISIDLIKSDNYADYKILEDAASKPKAGQEGLWLLANSMFLSRYPHVEVQARAEKVAKQLSDAKSGMDAVGRGAWEARAGNADAARAYLEQVSSESGDVGFFANLAMGIGDVKAVETEAEKLDAIAPEPRLPVPNEDERGEQTEGEEELAPTEAAPDAGEDDGEIRKDDGEIVEDTGEPAEEPAQKKETEPRQLELPPAVASIAERGRDALDAAIKLDPKSPIPHYWKGRLANALVRDEQALAEFQKAVDLDKDHVASNLALGAAEYDSGNLNKAIELLERVAGEMSAKAANAERAEALHYAGLVHVARRQSDLAIESFTKALEIDASRSDTLRALAGEYERAKKYKEALSFFTSNKNLGKKDPEVLLGIVRSHMGLEQWTQAAQTLEKGQKQFPDDARFPYYLGQLFLKRGAFADARKPLQSAVEIDDSLLTAHAALAQLAWRMEKDVELGEGHIAKIVSYSDQLDADVAGQVAEYYYMSGRRETSEQWYREALRRDPNHWPSRLALSKLLLEEGREAEAKELLERARKEGVQDVRLSAYLADAYRQAEDFDRAVDEINKVIEAFPKSEEYVFIRGRIHFDRGNLDNAQEDFTRAYDLNPRFHDAYFYVGRTAFERGDYATALKIFRHVLDYKPDRGNYRFYMGRTLEAESRSTQALEEYRKATAVDPAYGIENPEVYIYRGRLLSRLNYSKEGKADIARALELAPDSVDALLAMGESEYYDKAYSAAIQHYSRALQLEPSRADAQYRLGMSYLFTDKRQEAAQRLQLAIKHGYDDPEVYKRLGYLYRDLGQASQAKTAFKTFLERAQKKGNVPSSTKREVLNQIKQLR